jgi:N-acetylglucosamine-6-sulfatase
MTPTIHAIRTDRYKYIRPYGLWDVEELYDLQADPHEIVNLVHQPQHQKTAQELKSRLFQLLKETGGMSIPLFEDRDRQMNWRLESGTPQSRFPSHMMKK